MTEYGIIEPTPLAERTVVLASGKSLRGFDFYKLHRANCFVITVNESGKFAPFADAWFTLDPWGLYGPQLPGHHFQGKLYAAVPEGFGTAEAQLRAHRRKPAADITYLKRIHGHGLSEELDTIHTGNSGFGAFNLAYLLGAKEILILGIDGDYGYFYSEDKMNNALDHLPRMFNNSMEQIKRDDIRVINGSPKSSIDCFTRYTPDYALEVFLNG